MVVWDVIPSKGIVAARIGRLDGEVDCCVLCGEVEETTQHLLLDCLVSRIIWSNSPWALDIRKFLHHPLFLA